MFSLCEAMKWNHLPGPGAIYDQHPDLMDRFYYIFAMKSQVEAEEQKKRDREMGNQNPAGPRGRRR